MCVLYAVLLSAGRDREKEREIALKNYSFTHSSDHFMSCCPNSQWPHGHSFQEIMDLRIWLCLNVRSVTSCLKKYIYIEKTRKLQMDNLTNWTHRWFHFNMAVHFFFFPQRSRKKNWRRGIVPLAALNKHSNTSVKSNNLQLMEIQFAFRASQRWHFPHCNGALIKFILNAKKKNKRSAVREQPGCHCARHEEHGT